MTDGGAEPTLAEDEATLARLSEDFHRRLVAALPGWVAALVAARTGRSLDDDELARVAAVAEEVVGALGEPLRAVLGADPDAGAGSPLAVVRGAAPTVSALLDALGAARPGRDPFVGERFPDDHHDVGPASFADIDESLHEPGIVWGAARAHVHLRRRRERGDDG